MEEAQGLAVQADALCATLLCQFENLRLPPEESKRRNLTLRLFALYI